MIRKLFLTGLVIVLPITITYLIIMWFVHLITSPFHHFVQNILLESGFIANGFLHVTVEQATSAISTCLIICSVVLLVLLLGIISYYFLLKFFVAISDTILGNIPFIGRIYNAAKDFTQTVFSSTRESFTQVVLVPYPSKDHKAIGLVSGNYKNESLPISNREIVSVLVPGAPNPTIGFVLLFPKEDVIYIDISVTDALRLIMSCGTATLQK